MLQSKVNFISLPNTEDSFDKSSHRYAESEHSFTRRLTLLSEVTNELSKQKTSEDLFRRVIEPGHDKLDFDRLTLFLISADRQSMKGTFGVDTGGNITDEREVCFHIDPASRIHRIVSGDDKLVRYTDVPLYLNGRIVGNGMRVCRVLGQEQN